MRMIRPRLKMTPPRHSGSIFKPSASAFAATRAAMLSALGGFATVLFLRDSLTGRFARAAFGFRLDLRFMSAAAEIPRRNDTPHGVSRTTEAPASQWYTHPCLVGNGRKSGRPSDQGRSGYAARRSGGAVRRCPRADAARRQPGPGYRDAAD